MATPTGEIIHKKKLKNQTKGLPYSDQQREGRSNAGFIKHDAKLQKVGARKIRFRWNIADRILSIRKRGGGGVERRRGG